MKSFHPELEGIFWTSKILATFPFDEEFRLSKKWLAYCFAMRLLVLIGYINAFNYPSPVFSQLDDSVSMSKAFRMVPFICGLGEMFFCVIWWARKRKVVHSLMVNTGKMLLKSKMSANRKRVRLVHYLLLMSLLTHLYSYYTARHENKLFQNVCNEIAYFLNTSSTLTSIGLFWDLLHLLGNLFEEHTRLFDESSVVSYEIFSRLSDMTNEIFELKLLFIITTFFIHIIFYLYILLLPLNPSFNEFSFLTLILAANCFIPIVVIICACDNYTNKEKNFNHELSRRIIEEKSWISNRSGKVDFHFVVRHETAFSACGFFTIDRSLLCSMISAATTYLVIVLQYGNQETAETQKPFQ